MSFEGWCQINIPNTNQLNESNVQIHDRMIFQLCFAYDFNTPILANSAAFYLIPVSLSENDALVPSLMECGKSWQIFLGFFLIFAELSF